jgi:hypothetical protein
MPSGGNSAARNNPKNLSKDLLLHSQVRRQLVSLRGRELNAATARGGGSDKIVGTNGERRKRRMCSAGKGVTWINLNSPSRGLPLHHRSHVKEVSVAAARDRDPGKLVKRVSAIRKLQTSSERPKLRRFLLVRRPSRLHRGVRTFVGSKGVARPQRAANPKFNSSGSAGTKEVKVRSPPARKASSNNRAETVRRARRRAPKAKAPKAAKSKARTGEASKRLFAYTAVLDFVEETRILCGDEKTFPRFRLRSFHLGFGFCRRLLLR